MPGSKSSLKTSSVEARSYPKSLVTRTPTDEITVVESDAQHRELLCRLEDTSLVVAFDLESEGVNPREESPVGRGLPVCFSLAYADPALGLHPKYRTPLGRRYFLWADSLGYFRDWLSSREHHKVGDALFSFDRHVLRNAGFILEGILCDNLRLSKLLAAHSTEHDLKSFMERELGYKTENYKDVFKRRICLGEEDHGEGSYRYRTVDGQRVRTFVGGPASRVGASWETLDIRRFASEYPDQLHRAYEYASLDAKGSLERYYIQRGVAESVPWRGLGAKQPWGTLWDFYREVWNPFLGILFELERTGIRYEPSKISGGTKAAGVRVSQLLESVQQWTGDSEFNPGSGPQLTALLYGHFGYPVPPVKGSRTALKKTKPGEQPTTEASLAWLKANGYGSPGLDALIQWRKEARQLQFLEKLPTHVLPATGRIHSVLQPEAATGRLTSKNPNLQQIPKRYDPYGIRSAFIPGEGNLFVVADFCQLEMVVLAHFLIALFGDRTLANDLETGDAHSATALRLTLPREVAKEINYGINYKKGAMGLGLSLGIPRESAQLLLDRHNRAYPSIRRFQEYCFNEAVKTGVVRTLGGRLRPLPDARSELSRIRDAAARQAANTPIQGSAADIVVSAMLKLQRELPPNARMVLQVHDELIVECPREASEETLATVTRCMENPFARELLLVPLTVDAKVATSWLEGKS